MSDNKTFALGIGVGAYIVLQRQEGWPIALLAGLVLFVFAWGYSSAFDFMLGRVQRWLRRRA